MTQLTIYQNENASKPFTSQRTLKKEDGKTPLITFEAFMY